MTPGRKRYGRRGPAVEKPGVSRPAGRLGFGSLPLPTRARSKEPRSTKAESRVACVSVDTPAASATAAAMVVARGQLLWLGSRSSERVPV